MIFHPTVNPADPAIDTDSAEFRAKAQWAADHLNCPYPNLEPYMDFSPAAHNQDYPDVEASMHEYCNLSFAVPMNEGDTSGEKRWMDVVVDAEACWRYPKAVVNYIAAKTGRTDLQWWGPDYAPADTLPDWKVPGSHIGPPLGSPVGFFQFRWTGEAPGTRITGASGATYILDRVGAGLFSMPAWRKE